jgi:hypothetical protein
MNNNKRGAIMKTNLIQKFKMVFLATAALNSSASFANHTQPVASLGQIAYGGSGCKDGSIRLEAGRGRDHGNLILQMSDYFVSTDGRQIARAACSLTIPIQVPEGFALVMPPMLLKGYAKLRGGDQAKLNTEIFVAGQRGEKQITEIESSNDGSFVAIATNGNSFTAPCGSDVNLRLNTSVLLNGQYNSGSYVQVDKLKIPFPLKLVACSK